MKKNPKLLFTGSEIIPSVDFMELDGDYYIYLEGDTETQISREQLKEFRNSIHNLLIDLNMELGYEE